MDLIKQDHKYRMEGRNPLDFLADIKEGHKQERKIIEKFGRLIKRETGKKPRIQANGCDMQGSLLRYNNVTTEPDFVVNGEAFEVKFNRPHVPVLDLKVNQIQAYIRQGNKVLVVNGWATEEPVYTILSIEDLKQIVKTAPVIKKEKWKGKLVYKVQADLYNWKSFK
jgi:hypothetical protein